MRKTTSIELELFKGGDNGVKFYAKQFDDLKLKVKVFDGTEQVDISKQDITVFILKEDKTVIEQKKDISIDEDNTIFIDLSKQSTTALGKCLMELSLSDEEGNASTSTVSYMVGEKLSASIVDMIKSEDDINALNLIEEFIEASNIDILEIKEAIQELRDYTVNAENTLEDKYNEIIKALEDYKSELIENTKAEINEIVSSIDEAVEKAEEAVEIVNNSLERIEGIEELVSGAINDINDTKIEVIETINTKKEQSLTEMEEKGTEIIETISEEGQVVTDLVDKALESISGVDIKVEEGLSSIEDKKVRSINLIDETTETNIGNINDKGEEVKEGIANSSLLELNKIHNAREEAIVKIGEKEAEVLSNIEGSKEGVIEELTNSISTLKEQAKADLDTVLEEVINEGTLDINAIEEEIQSMKIDVENILTSIIEKIGEANTTYEELAELIEEAKRIIGLTRAFIEEKAVDLSNYYTKEEVDELLSNIDLSSMYTKDETDNLIGEAITPLATKEEVNDLSNLLNENIEEIKEDLSLYATKEELNEGITEVNNRVDEAVDDVNNVVNNVNDLVDEVNKTVEDIKEEINNIDLSIFYTKGETDNLIGEAITPLATKEELEAKFKLAGAMGDSPIPGIFMNRPEPPEDVIGEIWGYCNWKKRYFIVQFIRFKNTPFLYIGSDTYINIESSGSYSYVWNGTEWVSAGSPTFYINNIENDYNKTINNAVYKNIFYTTFKIYKSGTNTVLLEPLPLPEIIFISDFDGAKNEGKYKVLQEEDVTLDNSPTTERIEGVMNVIDIEDYIIQMVSSLDGKRYIRGLKKNEGWTEWKEGAGGASNIDLSSLATKEEVDNLIGEAITPLATKEDLEDAINSIDIPDIDMTNIYTKEEINELVENVSVDLSSYSTTEEIKALINESVGVVRSSLIEDINDIVRGL